MASVIDGWRTALRNRMFRNQLFLSFAALLILIFLLRVFLEYAEARIGTAVRDPLLQFLPTLDVTLITYSLIYSGLLLGVVSVCLSPYTFILAVRALAVMALLRIVCLYLLPLDPPAGALPLADPIIPWPFFSPPLTRDLFFSGYGGLMALFALTVRWRDMKIIFWGACCAISLLLLLQHAHYTIDVVAAPCFAYVAYGAAQWGSIKEAIVMAGISHSGRAIPPR